MAEKSKISVRNIRREANDVLKAMLKERRLAKMKTINSKKKFRRLQIRK
jgi:ribosome recycling factor